MTATAQIPFEDVHEHDGKYYYVVPNEDLATWSSLLEKEGVNVHKGAGICSGGEVGLIAMLPHVQRELVLIDHSYRSLSIALIKYLMFQNLGYEETVKVLTSENPNAITEAFGKFKDDLPEKLKEGCTRAFGDAANRYGYGDWSSYNRQGTCKKLAEMWKEPTAAHSVRKLGKVKFVHGDLSDLDKLGPFGLVYLSNALDSNHRSRTGASAMVDTVNAATRKGSYIIECCNALSTGSYNRYGAKKAPDNWKLIEQLDSKDGWYGWKYRLWRVK